MEKMRIWKERLLTQVAKKVELLVAAVQDIARPSKSCNHHTYLFNRNIHLSVGMRYLHVLHNDYSTSNECCVRLPSFPSPFPFPILVSCPPCVHLPSSSQIMQPNKKTRKESGNRLFQLLVHIVLMHISICTCMYTENSAIII